MDLIEGETVTVLRQGDVDDFGDPIAGDEFTESHTVSGVVFSHDTMDSTSANLKDWSVDGKVYMPYGADVKPTDRIERANGDLVRVIGKPQPYEFGLASGVVFKYREVSGWSNGT